MLTVRRLTKRFGGLVAVRDVDLDVAPGQILGLIGPNGSGKTTVLNLITGELAVDSGEIRFRGTNLVGARPFQICRRGVSRTFQLVRVMGEMTVLENVLVGRLFGSAPARGRAAVAEAAALLDYVGLTGKAYSPARDLTYIDQKRVELARALATRPTLLLLDEWLSGLNPSELRAGIALVDRISQSGIAVILVEHVMSAVRALCHRVVVMNAGAKIAEGTPDEVLSHPEVMQAYLGDDDA